MIIPLLFDGSQCPFCGRKVGHPDFATRATYLWSNQYGYSKRIFCRCGKWTDYKDISGQITCTRWRDEKGEWHIPVNDGGF